MTAPTAAPQRPSRPARAFRWAATAVTAALAVGTVTGFLGDVWWVFDLTSHLRVHLAVLSTLLAVGLAIGRRWVTAAVAGAAALVNLVLVVPLLAAAPAPAEPGAEVLRVSFLNVRIRGADTDAVVEYLRTRDDDLVVLAAGTRRWVEALESSDLGLHVVAGPRRGLDLEIIVLAREPGLESQVHRSADDSRSALVDVRLELDGQPLRLLATHPVSPQTPARAARRDHHFAWVREWAAARDGPFVVVGDLNATPWAAPMRSLLRDGGLVDSGRGQGWQPTWPTSLGPAGIPIDHVLHSPELTTVERRLGPSFGSSHRMVHVRLAARSPS